MMGTQLSDRLKRIFESYGQIFQSSHRGVKDVLLAGAPNAVQLLTGLGASVLIARGLGAEGMGQYTLAMTIAGLTISLSDLGIGQTAVRYGARALKYGSTQEHYAVLRWAFRWRLVLIAIVTGALFLLSRWIAKEFWHEANLTYFVRLGLASGVAGSLASIPSAYFQSRKEFRKNSNVLIVQTLISFSGIVLLAVMSLWTVEAVLVVGLLGAGIGAGIFAVIVPRQSLFVIDDFAKGGSPMRSPVITSTGDAVDDPGAETFALYFLGSTVLAIMILRVDVAMMGYYLPQEEIGLYGVATRFAMPLAMLLAAVNTALWPRVSATGSIMEKSALLKKTLKIMLLFAVFIAIYAVFVPMLTPEIFGAEYAGSTLIAQVLCLRYSLAIIASSTGAIGYSLGLVRFYWIINGIQLVAIIVINVELLPRIGAIGAALALIVNELISVSSIGFLVWRKMRSLSVAKG